MNRFIPELNFSEFIDGVFNTAFLRYFYTLGAQKHRIKRRGVVMELNRQPCGFARWEPRPCTCFDMWLSLTQRAYWFEPRVRGDKFWEAWFRLFGLPCTTYLVLREDRTDDEVRFHAFVEMGGEGCLRLWRNLTGGWAYVNRELRRETQNMDKGLIRYMVMRKKYPLTVRCKAHVGNFHHFDFIPERPKS